MNKWMIVQIHNFIIMHLEHANHVKQNLSQMQKKQGAFVRKVLDILEKVFMIKALI